MSERPLLSRSAGSYTSFGALWQVLKRRRRMIGLIEAGLLLLCLLYCIVAPNQYEASAWVEMRSESAPTLSLETNQAVFSASILSAPMALETQANVFRSDQLAWRVITGLKLYQAAGFKGRFEQRFAGFNADHPNVAAEQWLLGRFHGRLHVQALPRTLILEIRFRSRDAALSAEVVNALIRAYQQEQSEQRRQIALQNSDWLSSQLKQLRQQMDEDQKRLDAFRTTHGVLSQPQPGPNGVAQEVAHDSILQRIDDQGKQLGEATSDRILSEAELHAAEQGDPELVVASDPHLQAAGNEFPVALLQQLRARRSDLDLERAQLSAEHGPNFPRVVEIGRQLQDLEAQKKAEDAHLLANFRSALGTARSREQMVRNNLEELTAEGLKQNEAETEYARMRQEANTSQLLYSQVLAKMQESGITAGLQSGNLSIVDPALTPSRPVAPNPPLYLAIVGFVGLWVAVVTVLLAENLDRGAHKAALLLLALGLAATARGQAPTPSTSGLPAGVARITSSQQTQVLPNPQESPTIWNGAASMAVQPGATPATTAQAVPMAALISPDDLLDVSEFHTPEFHTAVRVSATGTVTLPMIDQVKVGGLSELQAAHAIGAALVAKGMLLHPLVSVVVTQYSGQDVSVLGEVTRPGVYPYTVHHRLLDLLSAASGLAPTAGRLVNIYHREDSKTPHPVVLDPGGNDAIAEHNPELKPGDTVQVSRAGLVYVIGAVIRPGGFPVDPAQGLTVVQALSLAWGPAQNASAQHALLIREQKGGRTMTTLNLHRMLRGQEPDLPIRDRDILFVPDSTARNLWNRTLESSIQSLVGVTIYSALVYSQRY
ncbi:SLBB domain-containing protein [Telmatobacter bradus]|uniref:SLBB domain-containing protein n=1 Tax=Telmatobacter bradus TaxID=474953 RepID=UPI003B42BCA4